MIWRIKWNVINFEFCTEPDLNIPIQIQFK